MSSASRFLEIGRKSLIALRRPLSSSFSNNVSLLPIDRTRTHPVFYVHADYLQSKTPIPLPHRVIHTINWKPEMLPHRRYVAEVESLFSVVPRSKRGSEVKPRKLTDYIDNEIHCGRLLKIVFDSRSAMELHRQWFTPAIDRISTAVSVVPTCLDFLPERPATSNARRLTIVVIGTKFVEKGMFLLRDIIDGLGTYRDAIRIICISSEDHPKLRELPEVDIRVITRMTPEQRRQLFSEVDLHVSLSLGDALGIYIDSIQFGVPMLSFKGQNAPTYIVDGENGILLDNPIYFYSDKLGVRYHDRHQFAAYLLELHEKGAFVESVEKIVASLKRLIDEPAIMSQMRLAMQRRARSEFTVDLWLNEWHKVYYSI